MGIGAVLNTKEIETIENFVKNGGTEQEWNSFCDNVKAARAGEYPSDWTEKVFLRGIPGILNLTNRFDIKTEIEKYKQLKT